MEKIRFGRIRQLGLYLKCVFIIRSVDYDYFTKYSSQPVLENGIEVAT